MTNERLWPEQCGITITNTNANANASADANVSSNASKKTPDLKLIKVSHSNIPTPFRRPAPPSLLPLPNHAITAFPRVRRCHDVAPALADIPELLVDDLITILISPGAAGGANSLAAAVAIE